MKAKHTRNGNVKVVMSFEAASQLREVLEFSRLTGMSPHALDVCETLDEALEDTFIPLPDHL